MRCLAGLLVKTLLSQEIFVASAGDLKLNSKCYQHFKCLSWKMFSPVQVNCCGASVASEQQHNQDLRRIYRRGYEFSNSSLFTRMHCS